jgi:hypothetical protein
VEAAEEEAEVPEPEEEAEEEAVPLLLAGHSTGGKDDSYNL